MFDQIYIGVTNRCNGKCFTCNLEVFDEYRWKKELPVWVIEKAIKATKRIIYIGEMGDFIFHDDALKIAQLTIDNDVWFRTDTNGSVWHKDWWQELARITKQNNSLIRFNIDHLTEDVHRCVNTKRALENMQTFINAGGRADVKTILFNFNYKEIDTMASVFKDMGVQRFSTIRSRVYQAQGPLSPPPSTLSTLQTCAQIVKGKQGRLHVKECPWKKNKICYINEQGELKACCHLVFEGLYHAKGISEFMQPWIGDQMFHDVKKLYEEHRHEISLYTESVESAYNSKFNQELMNNPNDYTICQFRCNLPPDMKDKILYETHIF